MVLSVNALGTLLETSSLIMISFIDIQLREEYQSMRQQQSCWRTIIPMVSILTLIHSSFPLPALFLRRDPSFLQQIPFHEVKFVEDEVGRTRANYFAGQVEKIAPVRFYLTESLQNLSMFRNNVSVIRVRPKESIIDIRNTFNSLKWTHSNRLSRFSLLIFILSSKNSAIPYDSYGELFRVHR